MKKILCSLLAVLMLASALLITPVSANGATSLDDYLIVNWDFEGDTQEDALKDKAAGGTKEDLCFSYEVIDKNGVATEGLASDTRVENGLLFISAAHNDRAVCDLPDDSDVKKAQELTFYYDFELITPNTDWIDVLYVKGKNTSGASKEFIRHCVMHNSSTAAGKIRSRMGGYTSNSDSKQAYVWGTRACVAISVKYFPDGYIRESDGKNLSGQYCFDIFVSYDGGETWAQELNDRDKDIKNVASLNTLWQISLGKGVSSHYRNGALIYDNVRVYNKALELSEVESIGKSLVVKEPALYYGAQFRTYTEGEKNLFDTRLIAQISEDAVEAGFIVYATDTWTKKEDGWKDTVGEPNPYSNLYNLTTAVTRCYSSVLEKDAQVNSDEGKKFIVLNVEGADQAKLPIFTVIPWEKDANGNVTYGATQLIHVTAEMLAA